MNEADAIVGFGAVLTLAYLSRKPWFRRMVVDAAKASRKRGRRLLM